MTRFAALAATVVGLILPGVGSVASAAEQDARTQYVATIRVADQENYRVRLVEKDDIENAFRLLRGDRDAPRIPNGKIVRGSADVNIGYSWHIDPKDFAWADFAMEICDGLPSHVEDGTLTSDRYCPWSAKVLSVAPLP
ncbi:hypothetical protein GCM10012275_06660 [Longimycelium tulufanense]|uniref:BP74 N-terminal domain-containing protein n=1 Tax=Longimycelium tulufanense TaxID=907463 RepID=A0A8J3CAA8_9PSEU|nr:hypothetical protein [Longimycelium tulufanense]GGM38325.1 hypothetical protein GCM10012275_06660 [Longimycelium tulufanense]